jgi:hypothetical protein
MRIIGEYFENLYSIKLANLDEMNIFLDAYIHPKLNQDIDHLNSPITCNEIEAVIRSNKAEFYQIFKKELTSILLKLFF